jgi:hypothetical protein
MTLPRLLALATATVGLAAWAVHFQSGLVLSHYDAKAHLVVARRVFDNLTPGWQQIGAVWLPLPHLLTLVPTQIDVFYRTGIFASAVSVASFALCAWAGARLVLAVTGSSAGAVAAVMLLACNPNLLYLQATPMTEPLLLGLTALVVLWLYEWVQRDRDEVPLRLGLALAALAWTRYEGWAVVGSAWAAAVYATWRYGTPPRVAVQRSLRLAAWPGAAVVLFLVNSRITVGAWFVSGGFYVPDPAYQGQVLRTLVSLWWGTHQLSGYVVEVVALATAGVLAGRAVMRRRDAGLMIPLALLAGAALPFVAFVEGHPYRIRYMIPIVAGCATLAGIGIGTMRRGGAVAAALVVSVTVLESPFWSRDTPLLAEAQWDRPNSVARRAVTACLAREYRGEKIVASMGSLAHYMQEMSAEGFDIADFVNEGNGVIWELAMETGPAPHAGWMLVEEIAEGGDSLARRIREDPAFATGMRPVCTGGGVRLYQRVSSSEPDPGSELIRPAAEIEHAALEDVGEVGLSRAVADLAADGEAVGREANTAETQGAWLVAVGDEAVAEDHAFDVHELTRLAVPPVEDGEAHAEVGLHAVRLPERQHAYRRRQRDDSQPKVLVDLGAVVVHEILVDGGHRAAVEPEARAELEVFAGGDQPLGADSGAVEVFHVEQQDVAILDERVVADARVEAARDEAAECEVERLLRRAGGRRDCHDATREEQHGSESIDHHGPPPAQ